MVGVVTSDKCSLCVVRGDDGEALPGTCSSCGQHSSTSPSLPSTSSSSATLATAMASSVPSSSLPWKEMSYTSIICLSVSLRFMLEEGGGVCAYSEPAWGCCSRH